MSSLLSIWFHSPVGMILNTSFLLSCKLDQFMLFTLTKAAVEHLSSQHLTFSTLVCKRMPLQFGFRAVCVCFLYYCKAVLLPKWHILFGTVADRSMQLPNRCQVPFSPQTLLFEVARVTPRLHIYGVLHVCNNPEENKYLLHHIDRNNSWFLDLFKSFSRCVKTFYLQV